MEPKKYFKKKIIGKLITRKIKDLNLRDSIVDQYKKSSIEEEKEYEVLEYVEEFDGYVVNEWDNEAEVCVLFIHNNFVKEYRRV